MSIALSRKLKQLILGNSAYTDGSLKDVMSGFTLVIFSGSRPEFPESSTISTALVTYTGCDLYEATYDSSIDNVVIKKEPVNWSALASAGGTATWFRCFIPTGGDSGTNADTFYAYPRIDGDVSDTTGDLVMSDIYIALGESKVIDQFNIAVT